MWLLVTIFWWCIYTVSQKVSTFKLSVTLSDLNKFWKCFCTGGKCMKFATKPIWHYPPHLRHVAILPWEIKNSNFLPKWKKTQKIAFLIASNFVIHSPILIFSVFKIASLSSYWLQIKFCVSLIFYSFTFAINLWHRKFVTADVTAVFVNNQHGIQRRGQDFDKKFVFEWVYIKEVDRRIFWEKLDKVWC